MTPAPAFDILHTLPGPNRLVGLFLARLFGYLLRLHHAGQTEAPADIVSMVHSADDMVDACIRYLAACQLNAAGCPAAAEALRSTPEDCTPAASQTLMESASPAELIERLQTSIDMFERAEALASELACLMLCLHCLISPWRRGPRLHTGLIRAPALQARRLGLGPPTPYPMGRGPPAFSPPIPNLIWDPCQSTGKVQGGTSQAWIPAFAGIFG